MNSLDGVKYYSDEEIRETLLGLQQRGVDVDSIPDSCIVEDLFRMLREFRKAN